MWLFEILHPVRVICSVKLFDLFLEFVDSLCYGGFIFPWGFGKVFLVQSYISHCSSHL